MKKEKLIIFGIILMTILIGIFVYIFIKDNIKEKEPISNNPIQENSEPTLKEFIDSEEGHDLSITLSNYGYEIFTQKKYLNYQKTEEGAYYLTKRELIDLGYDLSKLDSNCEEGTPIMFIFADENGNATNGKTLPVSYKMSCTLK